MRVSKNNKINYIKKELAKLISYVNLSSADEEHYRWAEGGKTYTVRKNVFLGNPIFTWEVYCSISENNKILGETFIYKSDYDVGVLQDEFFDYETYKFQIL
jgi:hypothetical protein